MASGSRAVWATSASLPPVPDITMPAATTRRSPDLAPPSGTVSETPAPSPGRARTPAVPGRGSEQLVIRRRRSAPVVPAAPVALVVPVVPSAVVAVVPALPAAPDLPAKAVSTSKREQRSRVARSRRLWTTGNQVLLALLLWTGLAAIVYTLDPDDPAARGAFFAALFGALFFTLVPLIRGVSLQFSHSRLYQEAVGWHATRQAFMVATFVTLNTFFQMQRSWSGLTALILFSVFAVIEIVALARR